MIYEFDGKTRSDLCYLLDKKHPPGSKILLELTVVSTGVCDPFPTEYIICRTKCGQDLLAKIPDVYQGETL